MTENGSAPPLPRVTVLMTVYNGARYLDETVRSILGQSFTDFEFVIVDDGSTDATPAMLARWAAADPRVVVLTSSENRGQAASINRGLAAARGEYVARTDADDVSEPDRLRFQVDVLDARPELVLVSMNYLLMRADGRLLRRTFHDAPPEVIAYLLNFGNAVGGHGLVMFRRDAVLAAGGYDESLPVAQDYDLWARLSRVGGLVVLPGIGMRYRLHDDRISVRMGDRQRQASAVVTRRLLSDYLGRRLTGGEVEPLTAVWSNVPSKADPRTALPLFEEAYRLFVAREGREARFARRVREEYANRLVAMSVTLALAGRPGAALSLFVAGIRWHPAAALRRVFRLARHGFSAWRAARIP